MIPNKYKIADEHQARRILWEIERRAKHQPDFVDHKFPEQAAFVTDESRYKAILCPRRAGKSFGMGRRLVMRAYKYPRTVHGYIALTETSSRNIMWDAVLKVLDMQFGLRARFIDGRLEMILPNESVICLAGADSKPDDMRKFLGRKFKTLMIDESGEWRQDLNKLVYVILRPTLADLKGELTLGGTPGDLCSGLFYELTGARSKKNWSVHSWDTLNNPYVDWQSELDELLAEDPRVVETPWFKRMYKGQWVMDDSKRVYKYDPQKNWIETLPEGNYTYGLGVDIGWNDDNAFVLTAYQDDDPCLYILEVVKKPHMDFTDVGEMINLYRNRYPIAGIDIDGANKQGVMEMKRRMRLPLTPAEKHGKVEYIELMNADFTQEKIKLVGDRCQDLAKEYANLIWDDQSKRREEHPSCPNHAADAALYRWRRCYNFLYTKQELRVKSEEEKLDDWVKEEEEKINKPNDLEWWEDEAYGT